MAKAKVTQPKKQMIIVHVVSVEDPWEAEGAFLPDGTCLGWWSCNDANWRDEYFNGWLEEVGVKVVECYNTSKPLYKKLQNVLRKEIEQC